MQTFSTTLTKKGQATIPVYVRRALRLNPADSVVFRVSDKNTVTLEKISAPENAYLSSLSSLCSEWESSSDNQAYNDL